VTVGPFVVLPSWVRALVVAGPAVAGALPLVAYHAAPSLRERWVGSRRGAFVVWAGTIVGGIAVGSALGYAYVAPTVISYLVIDAIEAGMLIKYTINDFFWLVFATTVGIGLLAEIPLTMWLFHRAGIVTYRRMMDSWRGVVFVVFVAAAVLTDRSLVSMFLFGIPVTLMYWSGLVGIWVGGLPRRALRRVGVGA
jgi:sec-independent protein translocase protein TatC